MQIQKAAQSAYDVLLLRCHGRGETITLLVSLSPGACRLHRTGMALVKSEKPLRFAQFLSSKIINSRIEEAVQLLSRSGITASLICADGGITYVQRLASAFALLGDALSYDLT